MSTPRFSSRISTVLTMVGVAVGLGNVWRFPYMMGKYGGSAFLFVYLGFTIFFALPALITEISLGRISRKGPVGAFKYAFGNTIGTIVGYILFATILVASSYYVIIISNVVYSAYFSLRFNFEGELLAVYLDHLNNPGLQYVISVILISSALLFIYKGLKKGIESISKIIVPFFLLVIIFLIVHALSLPNAPSKFLQFLSPDFGSLTIGNIFAALGQSVYSLSLGGTFMVMYGSYLKKDENIHYISIFTGLGDVGAALLSSLFIVPTILVFELNLSAGPNLLFETLPRLFSIMNGGYFIGGLFLFALSLVSFLSLIAALEVARACFMELTKNKIKKVTILLLIALIEMLLIIPCVFVSSLIGKLDLIFGSGMQLIGSLAAVIAVGWFSRKHGSTFIINTFSTSKYNNWFLFWIKWIIPITLLIILVRYIYSA